jgi:hypothetical protein
MRTTPVTVAALAAALLLTACDNGGAGDEKDDHARPAASGAPAAPAASYPDHWTGRPAQQQNLHRARARDGQPDHRRAAGLSESRT